MKKETMRTCLVVTAILGSLVLILLALLSGCTLKGATIEDLEIKPPYKEKPAGTPAPEKRRL